MAWCLTPPLTDNDHRQMTMIHRFDPRFWTVDFPRPMLGCVVATAPDALRATLAFTGQDSLAGLIWESKDRWDHPLLAYLERRDYRHTQLRFRWRSGGMKPLDAVHGPTLTIEGRDASGTPRSWYVRPLPSSSCRVWLVASSAFTLRCSQRMPARRTSGSRGMAHSSWV